MEEAFPQAIAQADNIADRLREQAEAVAQAEEKRFQITQSEKQNQEAEEAIRVLQNKLEACQAAWEALWLPCGMAPRTPGEMEEWREIWSDFKGHLRQLRAAEESFQRKSDQVQQAKKQLAAVLSEPVEKGFTLLYDKAIRKVQQGEQASGRRIEIAEQLRTLKTQLETFHQKQRSGRYRVRCGIGQMEVTVPCDWAAGRYFSRFQDWLFCGNERKFSQNSISGKKYPPELQKTTQAIRQYEQAVNDHCNALGIQGDTTEAQVSRLWDALTSAREAQTLYNQLAGQIHEAKSDLTGVQESCAQADHALESLARLAKLDTVEALEPLLANLELRDQAQCQIATFRDTLSGLARGQTVDDFLARIRAEDTETLAQRKGMLLNRKNDKETALQAIRDTLSELKGRKQGLEAAGDAAANYRQQAESVAARLKQDACRFVRLRLAVHFLQTQIERFRKENQGPLLEKSGQVFQDITRGAFAGLGAEFNADDVPILVGLRPDQSSVPISGMSDGSRDQLYLALRLAALDRYLEAHEPMPLILDDLLITFDDDRATAILPQLAALARRTQIFLFTHHDHLVELCRRTLGEDTFHLHRLGS